MLQSLPPLTLELLDGSAYSEQGRVETISGVLDPITRSANVRVLFSNPQRQLRSGSTGTILLPTTLEGVFEIPQQATVTIQNKIFVYLLEDGVAKSYEVQVYPQNDGVHYLVTSGLKAGDQLILDGAMTLRDGMPIQVQSEGSSSKDVAGAGV